MSVKQSYVKDENGSIISPIISAGSVYLPTGESIQSVINQNHMEEPIFQGNGDSAGNQTSINPTNTQFYVGSGFTPPSKNGKIVLPEGFYEVMVSARQKDTSNAADCSIAVEVKTSSGADYYGINIWERNYHRFTGYINLVVYVPNNGSISVHMYDDVNNTVGTTALVTIKKV